MRRQPEGCNGARLRPRRLKAMVCATAGWSFTRSTYASSTAHATCASGRRSARSVMAGRLWTMSPSEDSFTNRMRGAGMAHSNPALRVKWRSFAPLDRSVARSSADQLPLTVAIIAFNAGAQIGPCLASVGFADEVVVVDSGSTDDTAAIAARHGARVETREWLGFGRQKQHAVSLARNDWVLCLDVDERVSEPLALSIRAALASPRYRAYRMARRNRF